MSNQHNDPPAKKPSAVERLRKQRGAYTINPRTTDQVTEGAILELAEGCASLAERIQALESQSSIALPSAAKQDLPSDLFETFPPTISVYLGKQVIASNFPAPRANQKLVLDPSLCLTVVNEPAPAAPSPSEPKSNEPPAIELKGLKAECTGDHVLAILLPDGRRFVPEPVPSQEKQLFLPSEAFDILARGYMFNPFVMIDSASVPDALKVGDTIYRRMPSSESNRRQKKEER